MRIVEVGDPVLRARTGAGVGRRAGIAEIQELIDRLIVTRREAGGAGLAAPQVGVPRRVAIVRSTSTRGTRTSRSCR